MKILVCGSRTYPLDFVMPAILTAYGTAVDALTIIAGGAPGADRHAADWGHCHGVEVKEFKAKWPVCEFDGRVLCPDDAGAHRQVNRWGKQFCPLAGPRRNQRMLDEGEPDLVLAFVDKEPAKSRGTADMVERARKAGVPTYVIHAS